MNYATLADLQKWLDQDLLIRLTNDEGTGTVDTDIVDTVLEAASVEIDGYLGTRYSLPFSSPPAILKKYCTDIACHLLHLRRNEVDELWQAQYQNAVIFLKLVAKGTVSLGAGDPEAEDKADTPLKSTTTATFTSETLKRF